jgi:hypothetical protein
MGTEKRKMEQKIESWELRREKWNKRLKIGN